MAQGVKPGAPTLAERFALYTIETETGCLEWQLALCREGYGRISVNQRGREAYRVFYELFVGPVPKGLVLDHLCRNRKCVNPRHLEPVTNKENSLRGESFCAKYARQTHCVNGHPFSGHNLRAADNRRYCRACCAARTRAYQARKKAARLEGRPS